ncbi:MAG: hypothetical protein JSS02_27200 [Planctomycetes bacterium]|nr:hypothetical protein [Planctomycetota bacterium]
MKILDLPQRLRERRLFGVFDDFEWFLSPHLWSSFASGAGGASVAVASGAAMFGGVVLLTTGATLNNEAALGTTGAVFVPGARQPLLYEALLQFNEAATNKANLFAGFSDVVTATGQMQPGNAGVKASFNGFGLCKVGNTNVWSAVSSKGAVQTVTPSQTTAGGPAQQSLRVEINEIDAQTAEVTFFVNSQQLLDTAGRPIKHLVNYTAFANLQAGVYVSAGSAASEVVGVDYIAAYQQRGAFV